MKAKKILYSIRETVEDPIIEGLCDDLESELDELKEEISDQESKINELEQDLDTANDNIDELENEPNEHPFYDSDKETLEDARKSEMLADNWDRFTALQLEGFLKMIGINV